MEYCYRIALWMFCVIACIQAMPTPKPSVPTEKDLGLDDILQEIKCGNATFFSETKNETNIPVAIKCIYKELGTALTKCTGEHERIYNARESMDALMTATQSEETPDCPWTTGKRLTEFVEDVRDFFEKLRNMDI